MAIVYSLRHNCPYLPIAWAEGCLDITTPLGAVDHLLAHDKLGDMVFGITLASKVISHFEKVQLR